MGFRIKKELQVGSRGQDDGYPEGCRRQRRAPRGEALSSFRRTNDTDTQPSRIRHLAYGNAETFRAPSWRFGSAGQPERTVAVVPADAGLDRA